MAKSSGKGQALVISPEQLEQLWAELDQPYRIATQIAYFTAARLGEVLRLRAENVRAGSIIFPGTITKTARTREAVIPAQLRELMAIANLPRQGYLFPSGGKAGYMPRQLMDRHLRRAAALVGLEGVSMHSFRRSAATHLHLQGVPLRAIQKTTGHATLSSLERYLDIGAAEAAAAQQAALDRLFAGSEIGP